MDDIQSESNPYEQNGQLSQQQSINGESANQFVDHQQEPGQQNTHFYQIYGMFFCKTCNNIIQPLRSNGDLLEFKCKRCPNMTINFKNRQNQKCMLYSKALQEGSRRTIANSMFIFDPTMPRLTVQCPYCEYHEAVYLVTPEEGQRKINVKLICARGAQTDTIRCGQIWDLDQNDLIYKDIIEPAQYQN